MTAHNYNDRFDDISYEKGWQRTSVPEAYVPPEESDNEDGIRLKRSLKDKKPREKRAFQLLLPAVQLILCALILIAAMLFRQLGGEKYDEIKTLYFQNLNNSLFETPAENLLDLSEIFKSDNSSVTSETDDNAL